MTLHPGCIPTLQVVVPGHWRAGCAIIMRDSFNGRMPACHVGDRSSILLSRIAYKRCVMFEFAPQELIVRMRRMYNAGASVPEVILEIHRHNGWEQLRMINAIVCI